MDMEIRKSHLLVVEGKDEQLFFNALIRYLIESDNCTKAQNLSLIQILPIGGKTKIHENLELITTSPNFRQKVKCIGIVRDSDGNFTGAFDSIKKALKNAKLSIPQHPMILTTEEKPSIITMILPTEIEGFMLEDVCMASVIDDQATLCLNNYFNCLKCAGITIKDNRMPKAKVHAFLASRERPDKRLGEAAQAGYWNFDHSAFKKIRDFLNLLASA